MPIRVLDPQLAAKIAAGEVIERPASVVKELLDNAIDAGATHIRVEARAGGLSLMRVTDDGSGIPAAEIELAFARHATSKLQSVQDLAAIRSLGFRGEALHAIAAVAQVTIISKTAGEAAATMLHFEGGSVTQRTSRGAPDGTAILVENLFATVPARLKFLKSPAAETGRIGDVAAQYALAHPGIQISLIVDGRLSFQSTGSGKLEDVLVKVLGVDTARGMMPVQPAEEAQDVRGGESKVRVEGFISQPAVTRSTRSYMSFFVNSRWVQSRMLVYALEEAYHTLLQVGRRPLAVLNIQVPYDEVDVNVHPAKSEVRFLRERDVFVAVQKAVRGALVDAAGIPLAASYPGAAAPAAPARWQPPAPSGAEPAPYQPALAPWRPPQVAVSALPPAEPARSSAGQAASATKLPPLRILGQAALTYIIAESPEGVYLIDQHTAHERIIYEKLKAEYARLAVSSQGMLEPQAVEVTPRQAALLGVHGQELADLGFQIEPFGPSSMLVRAVPAILAGQNVGQALAEILDDMTDESGGLAPQAWQEALITTVTCHSAVRAGQSLTFDEMRQLVLQLEQTTLPRTCPHGRPTMILLSQAQLEKEFGRR